MNAKFWRSAVIAGGISVLVAVFLLAAAVAISLGAEDPEKQIGIWTLPIMIAGGGTAGGLSVKLCGEKSFLLPFVAGMLYILVLGIVALPFGEGFSFINLLLRAGLPLAASMLVGGTLGSRGTSRFGNSRKAARHAVKIYKGKR